MTKRKTRKERKKGKKKKEREKKGKRKKTCNYQCSRHLKERDRKKALRNRRLIKKAILHINKINIDLNEKHWNFEKITINFNIPLNYKTS
jgi:hypothetical protein